MKTSKRSPKKRGAQKGVARPTETRRAAKGARKRDPVATKTQNAPPSVAGDDGSASLGGSAKGVDVSFVLEGSSRDLRGGVHVPAFEAAPHASGNAFRDYGGRGAKDGGTQAAPKEVTGVESRAPVWTTRLGMPIAVVDERPSSSLAMVVSQNQGVGHVASEVALGRAKVAIPSWMAILGLCLTISYPLELLRSGAVIPGEYSGIIIGWLLMGLGVTAVVSLLVGVYHLMVPTKRATVGIFFWPDNIKRE